MVPVDYTFVAGDHGTHTFTNQTTLDTAGVATITAGGSIFGSANVTVNPAAASQFSISAPAGVTAGVPFSVTVTALDPFGNVATGYTGTVHFTKSDSGAGSAVPSDYHFVAGDQGVHTFTNGVTFVTGHGQTLNVSDNSAPPNNGSLSVPVIQPFAAGDIVVYRVGNGSGALTGDATQVYLDEYTTGGSLVQSVPLPVASISGGNQALVASGSATSEGELNLSGNGQYLVLTGYDTTLGTASVSSTASATTPRVVGLVSATGVINTTTALTDFSTGNNVRGATSTDGTNLWVAGTVGGVGYTTVGGTTSTDLDPTGEQNLRNVSVFGGQLYASSQKTLVLGTLGTAAPTTAPQSLTNLPGLPSSGSAVNANGFFFAHLNGAGNAADTLYITDQAANAGAGQVNKYSLVGGTWVAKGSIAVGSGVTGVTGIVTGSTVSLFFTAAGTLGNSGTLYHFTDSTGYNASVSGTAALIANAPINEAFRGVALAPTAPSDVNPPVVDLNGGASGINFTTANWNHSGAVSIADSANATVTDSDSTLLSSLTATIVSPAAGDTLTANTTGTSITASFSGGVLTLSGSDTPADYQQVLRSVQYNNTSASTPSGTRTINIVATDSGSLTSTPAAVSTVNLVSTIGARDLFYNNSKFDKNTPGIAGTTDDAAIAPDKSALLPAPRRPRRPTCRATARASTASWSTCKARGTTARSRWRTF